MLEENLYCYVTENKVGCGYHYCIRNHFAVSAYRTEKGYNAYLERTGLIPEFIESYIHTQNGKTDIYRLNGKYQEKSFWNIEEIPEDAKKFVGLSNGSYVDCYYADIEEIRTIFRPNPNAKEVYIPHNYQSYVWEN